VVFVNHLKRSNRIRRLAGLGERKHSPFHPRNPPRFQQLKISASIWATFLQVLTKICSAHFDIAQVQNWLLPYLAMGRESAISMTGLPFAKASRKFSEIEPKPRTNRPKMDRPLFVD